MRSVRNLRANSPRSRPGSILPGFDVADPYVERLLEGFALLAARIQLKLEAEFPTFTQSLLQIVYPHYLAPTPSMTVVQFRPEQTLRGTPQGVLLPRNTELHSLLGTEDQTNCDSVRHTRCNCCRSS